MSRSSAAASSSASPSASSSSVAPLSIGLSSVGYSEQRRWAVVYPHYLNSARSVAEGRRVPLRFAVERPSVADVVEACQALQLPFAVEPDKQYVRERHASSGRGRVRVQLYSNEHAPLSSEVRNKQQLLCRIGEVAPTLKMRPLRLEVEKKREEKELRELQQLLGGQAAASASSSAATSASNSSGSSSPSGSSTPTASDSAGGAGGGSAKKNKGKKKK